MAYRLAGLRFRGAWPACKQHKIYFSIFVILRMTIYKVSGIINLQKSGEKDICFFAVYQRYQVFLFFLYFRVLRVRSELFSKVF